MKRNFFLRAAVLLLAAVSASTAVCMETGAWARYTASVTFPASARAAKFSFKFGSHKPGTPASVNADGITTTAAKGWPNNDPSKPWEGNQVWNVKSSWDEIIVDPGSVTAWYEFPMFDSEYRNPAVNTVTVQSADSAMVIAPGTGTVYGLPKNNTNLRLGGHTYTHYGFRFRNDSEVRVNFQLYVNPGPVRALGLPIWFNRWDADWWNLLDTTHDNADGLILVYDSASFQTCYGDCLFESGDGNHDLAPMQESGSIFFDWHWQFETGDDARDTALGRAGTGIVSIPLLIKVTQVD